MIETRPTELAREARHQLGRALADINRPDREYGWPPIAAALAPAASATAATLTLALVDDSIETASNSNQWKYGGEEVVWGSTGWETKSGGVTWSKNGSPFIVNGMEANNQDDSVTPKLQSNGIVTGTFDDYKITLQPIRGDPVVPVIQVASGVWAMFQPNPVSVECIEA